MKISTCLLVAKTTVALACQSTGRSFHASRRSNFQLTRKISFRETSRFTAVAGDRNSGGSNGTSTSSTKHLLVNPTAVPEPTVLGNVIGWNTGTQPGINIGAPNGLAPGSQQPSAEEVTMKDQAVLLANTVHAAQRMSQAMVGLSSIVPSDRMTFIKVAGEGKALEVCHFPRALGMFPSFFDSFKQSEAVGSDFIFRRTRPVDQSRFEKTITALKKGRKVVWYGQPGIGKSTEANFVLLEFLQHLGDGEDSEWPTKVAHRVRGQLFLYTWNGTSGRVECDMLPGETLLDVNRFSRCWSDHAEKKPPVLFLELEESESDPLVSIPTFIALHSDDVQTTLKTIVKSGSGIFLLVHPHEPEEVLLMAKVIFEADPEQLCAHLGCETEWDKVAKIVSNRMAIVGPLVRQVFTWESAFDSYVDSM